MSVIFLPDEHAAFEAFKAAGAEGIAPNFRRWQRFAGVLPGEWTEVQVLDNGRGFTEAIDVDDENDAIRAIAEKEKQGAKAIYLIANALDAVATTRYQQGRWFAPKKGQSLTDNDITHRRVLYLDFDPDRPSHTSATDAQVREALSVAGRVRDFLADSCSFTESAMGFGMSGNGASLFLALDRLPSNAALTSLVKEILVAVQCLFETPTLKIDRSVFDPKRLIPAWGSYKRKGAPGITERPHRRCALLVPDLVRRLTLDQLHQVRGALVRELNEEQRTEVDRAAGRKKEAPKTSTAGSARGDDIFKLANEQDVQEVARRLGLVEGEHVMCPGCREVGDSSVAFVKNGLKCMHNRCADKGVKDGFRTPVDLVVEVENVEPIEAAKRILEWFGINAPKRQTARATRPVAEPGDRPEIVIRTAEHEVVDEAITALSADGEVFQRAASLVQVIEDQSRLRSATPKIHLLQTPVVRSKLTRFANWAKVVKGDDGKPMRVAAHPPDWAVRAVAAHGKWPGIRYLEGVVDTPMLRADGSILDEPGYDEQTGLLYCPSRAFEAVPMAPTLADAQWARDELFEAVADFPFSTDAHRAAWLAGLLTLFARYAFDGPAPMMMVDSNVRGAGKGLLVDAAGVIATGECTAVTALPADDEEIQKLITSMVLSGRSLVLFDNVTGDLGSPSLDMALTSRTWRQRILGKSEATDMPMRLTMWATGNNIMLAADTARRVLHIRLESREENPEDRTAFRHRDLRAWLQENRGRLVRAALTILRAFFVAGRPTHGLKPWGSYEAWSALVRGAVVWLGEQDPVETRIELAREADTEANTLRLVIEAMRASDPHSEGLSAAEMLRLASTAGNDTALMREAVGELCPVRGGQTPSTKALGRRLRAIKRRVSGGFMIDEKYKNRTGIIMWAVFDAAAKGVE
jgi:hypothetical protein